MDLRLCTNFNIPSVALTMHDIISSEYSQWLALNTQNFSYRKQKLTKESEVFKTDSIILETDFLLVASLELNDIKD